MLVVARAIALAIALAVSLAVVLVALAVAVTRVLAVALAIALAVAPTVALAVALAVSILLALLAPDKRGCKRAHLRLFFGKVDCWDDGTGYLGVYDCSAVAARPSHHFRYVGSVC